MTSLTLRKGVLPDPAPSGSSDELATRKSQLLAKLGEYGDAGVVSSGSGTGDTTDDATATADTNGADSNGASVTSKAAKPADSPSKLSAASPEFTPSSPDYAANGSPSMSPSMMGMGSPQFHAYYGYGYSPTLSPGMAGYPGMALPPLTLSSPMHSPEFQVRQLNPAVGSPDIVRTLNEQNAAAQGEASGSPTTAPNGSATPTRSPKKKPSKPQTLDQKILYQVQYYFSDKNLSKDRFLREQMAMDPRGEDWVMVSLIATFGKVKTLCKGNSETVVRCLRDSQWLMLSEDEKFVRRRQRYAFSKKVVKRTAYVTGLPATSNVSSVELLLGAYGKVEEVVFENKGVDKTRASVRFSDQGPVKRASKAFSKNKAQPVRVKPLIVHLKHLKEKSEKGQRGRTASEDGTADSVSLISEEDPKPKRRPRKRDEFNWRLEVRPDQERDARIERKRSDSDARRKQREQELKRKADIAAKQDPRFSKARTTAFRKRLQLKRRSTVGDDDSPAPIKVKDRTAKGPSGPGFDWSATGWSLPATHVGQPAATETSGDQAEETSTNGTNEQDSSTNAGTQSAASTTDDSKSCAKSVPSPPVSTSSVEVQA